MFSINLDTIKEKLRTLKVSKSSVILECKILYNSERRGWSCDFKKRNVSIKNSSFYLNQR